LTIPVSEFWGMIFAAMKKLSPKQVLAIRCPTRQENRIPYRLEQRDSSHPKKAAGICG
jgi:hypothetical protein